MVKPFQFQPLFRRETRAAQTRRLFNPQISFTRKATVNGGKSWLMAELPCISASVPTRVELMHAAVAGNERAVLHFGMSAQQRAVGHESHGRR